MVILMRHFDPPQAPRLGMGQYRYRYRYRIGIGQFLAVSVSANFFFAVSAVTDTLCSKDAFSGDGPIYHFDISLSATFFNIQ